MRRSSTLILALTIAGSTVAASASGWPPAARPAAATAAAASDTAAATVFLPNPVADLGDQTLTDRKDADYAALAPPYHDVLLTHLDRSGYLAGDWAQIVSETGDPAYSASGQFRYHRDDDRSEQVMAYYWITEAQKDIQSLGFGTTRRPVDMKPQRVRINQWGVDNSFATTHKDELRFGKGGVDDMRDLAASTVAAANRLYGRAVASQVRGAFVNRGLQ